MTKDILKLISRCDDCAKMRPKCYICIVYILKIHEQPYSRGYILVVNKLALEVVGREFEPRLSQDLK